MTENDRDARSGMEPAAGDSPNLVRRDLFLTIGGIILYTVLAFGVILGINAQAGFAMQWPGTSPQGENAINISVVHSNDTWGYTDPCG